MATTLRTSPQPQLRNQQTNHPTEWATRDGARGNALDHIPEIRSSNVAAHGFWTRDTTAIFDVRITDTNARSHRNSDPAKALERQVRERKTNNSDACREAHCHFTLLVFSIDGIRAKETIAASKRLGRLFSEKWKKAYSQIIGMIHSCLTVALVRAASSCLQDSQDVAARNFSLSWVEGTRIHLFH